MKEINATLLLFGFMVAIWPLPFWRYLAALGLCVAFSKVMIGS